VIRHNIAAGRPVPRSAAIVASWARYAEGTDEQGEPIDVQDQLAETLVPIAQSHTFLEDRELFGGLADNHRFRSAFDEALNSLHEHGARRTLERYQSV